MGKGLIYLKGKRRMLFQRKKSILLLLIWFIEGIVVGFGAILPGVSGGTLCVAFGMYRPIIETISNIRTGLKKHILMLGTFFLGIAAGFIGLSGLAAWLMEKNTILITCIFVGFILGTIPELWHDAGTKGRSKVSYVSMFLGFLVMLVVLYIFKTEIAINIEPNFAGYLLCGVLWGLSFIVPGLSSSSLLLFFGLYQPMLRGIAILDMNVLIPMACGMGVCVLILSKGVGYAYKKYYSIVSHSVLGIVMATTIMIVPAQYTSLSAIIVNVFSVLAGAVVSYQFTCICKKIQETIKSA